MDEFASTLADEFLADMDDSEAPVFFFHIFSNGGGFVWEAVLRILAESELAAPPAVSVAALDESSVESLPGASGEHPKASSSTMLRTNCAERVLLIRNRCKFGRREIAVI